MSECLEVHFPSGEAKCQAWLYLPEGPQPHPVLVMAHGLGGIRQVRLDAYAERFAAAGYACLVFDYRHFGASGGEPRQLLDIKLQLADWAAAIAYARSRADLDPARVVLWGTSFGGGHVIVAAARDGNVAATISQCPFTDGLASVLAMDPRTSVKVTARAVRDLIAAGLGRPTVMVPTAGPPGSAALMTAPDAVPGYLGLVDDEARAAGFDNQVAARVALHIVRYRPGRKAKRCAARSCSPSARPTVWPRRKPPCVMPVPRRGARSGSTRQATSTSTSATGSKPASPTNSPSSPTMSPSTTDRQRLESPSCLVTT